MSRPRRDQRGSTNLEAAIVIPVVLLMITLAVAAGRVQIARNAVSSAASAAARAASIERGSSNATAAAHQVAASTLAGSYCDPSVTVSGNMDAPAGTTATVTVTVQCSVSLSDLAVPGLPGSVTLTRSSRSVIDTYRGR